MDANTALLINQLNEMNKIKKIFVCMIYTCHACFDADCKAYPGGSLRTPHILMGRKSCTI